ncbi:MAG: AraC family transcriptional regulator [Rhodospirillaceae bacterium]|nr:MAG: AraC family transcriptional regulator [Rhodospirillaceae bacterium]
MMTIEAEIRVPAATVQLVRFHLAEPGNHVLRDEKAHWLDLCLTPRPRNARACYRDRWSPHRFEPIGDLFMVPSGEAMHARSDCGRQASVVCQLRPDLIQGSLDSAVEWTDRRLEASLDIANPGIRNLLFRLAGEARHPGFASGMLVELIATQMVIELSRYWTSIAEGPAVGGLASWRLRLIDERLREIRQAPALTELATLCNLSVRQLTRGFRASRGCSIGDYVEQCRIENAKRLLDTGETIKTISYSMGFASPSSFSYAFRRATGATPRQFRQRLVRESR